MRRTTVVALAAAAAIALGAAPAQADAYGSSGWEPTPDAASDIPAGVLCSFPVHLGIPFDAVKGKVLATYPDGSTEQEVYNGPLVVMVVNTATGAATSVNASGQAVVDYHLDGSQTWHWGGPVLMGFRVGRNSNHAPGLYLLTGNYTVDLSAAGKTVLQADGSERNLCTELA